MVESASETSPSAGVIALAERRGVVVNRLSRIHERHKRFDVSASEALKLERLSLVVLEDALDAGLKYAWRNGEAHLDRLDLYSIALYTEGSRSRNLMRAWYRTAARHQHSRNAKLVLRGHSPLTLPLRSTAQAPQVNDLVSPLESWIFVRLPMSVSGDMKFCMENEFADCRAFAEATLALLAKAGYSAHIRRGMAIVPPIAVSHTWCEIAVGEGLAALDVGVISYMRTNFGGNRDGVESLGHTLCEVDARELRSAVIAGGYC